MMLYICTEFRENISKDFKELLSGRYLHTEIYKEAKLCKNCRLSYGTCSFMSSDDDIHLSQVL